MNRPLFFAIVALLFVAGAATFFFVQQTPEPPVPTPEGPAGSLQPREEAGTAAGAESATAPPAAPLPGSEATVVPAEIRPSFDIVRMTPEGQAVMAGRAAPETTVKILNGAARLGTAETDARGEWVYVPEERLPPGTYELSLAVERADGPPLTSEDVVVLTVPEPESDGKVLAVQMDRDGGTEKVLQGRVKDDGMSVAAIDYNDRGRMGMTGTAAPGSSVLVYRDNVLIGRAEVDESGNWRFEPETDPQAADTGPDGAASAQDAPATGSPDTVPVAVARPSPGVIRVDQVDAAGQVQARLEIPVDWQSLTGIDRRNKLVIVQPGNSLWRIARRVYGSGFAYTVIYETNKDQIRDPDLIYPGQVFDLPTRMN